MRGASFCCRTSVRIWRHPLRGGLLLMGCSNAVLPLRLVSEGRRYKGNSSSLSTSTGSGSSFPKVPGTQGFELAAAKEAGSNELPPIIDTPAPPRPAFYVPPEERDPSDESLAFLKPGSPLEHLTQHQVDAQLPDGLDQAPFLTARMKVVPTYMDADAVRVQSTSVHAGKSLLNKRSVVDTGCYYENNCAQCTLDGGVSSAAASIRASHRSRLYTLQDAPPRSGAADAVPLSQTHSTVVPDDGGSSSTAKEHSIFAAAREFVAVDKSAEEVEDEKQRTAPKPSVKQLEADVKKLEYYYGTPQYQKLLSDFRKKYGGDGEANGKSNGDVSGAGDGANKLADCRVYTASEVDRGLDAQPIDYLRSSPRLQVQLVSGPRAYDPVTIMQQQGVMRFQGYAFPPTVELGKLKGDKDQLKALHNAHKSYPLVVRLRKSFNALIGRKDARDDYVSKEDKLKEDTHLIYRTLGLDAVQRRQMRYMLTDFDHADRHTTFHVMMSYPYTDWLHVFYMVLLGWCLYQLQVRYGAYEFYDEYMGLDLRQAPRLEKPVLAGITVTVMVLLLFQPLLVVSIATTRAYRIVMRRPIGPP